MDVKIKKDLMHLYLARNAFAVFLTTLLAICISLMHYYSITIFEAIYRVFVFDIYTTLYFLLLTLFNYIIFEISKIIYDEYEERLKWYPFPCYLVAFIFLLFLPLTDDFKYNFLFLILLIVGRIIKQTIKNKPSYLEGLKKFTQRSE